MSDCHPPRIVIRNRLCRGGVVAAALCVCFVQRPGPGSEAISTPPVAAPADEVAAFRASILPDGNTFTVPDGHWHFPGTDWVFSQTLADSPVAMTSAERDPGPLRLPASATRFDAQILTVVQSMMERTEASDGRIVYHVHHGELTGFAVSQMTSTREVPREVAVSWPASDGQYTHFRAQRVRAAQEPPPLVPLPDAAVVVATRMTTSGDRYCQFVRVSSGAAALERWFRGSGWRITKPNEDASASWYWIEKGTRRLEVSTHPARRSQMADVLIRRISE